MSETIIDSLHGVEPMREGEYPLYYKVGVDGVTQILQGSYCTEPYYERIFYQIYKGDKLFSVVNDQAVGQIIFKE